MSKLPAILSLFIFAWLISDKIQAEELSTSPHRVVEPVGLSDVRWTDGFWQDRFNFEMYNMGHLMTAACVHQAFGRNYQLPNTTAHNETCANIGNVLWNWRMFLASGDAKYVDVLELALYHSVLSGVGLNGTSLRDGSRIKLKQVTDYPWNGRVNITVDTGPKSELSLFVRIPGWADGAKLLVNGKPHEFTPGSYAEIRRHWNGGDEIQLTLPMEPQLVEAHPLVEETRSQIAVKRGPLVYCLESDRRETHPILRVVQSREVRNDRLDATGEMTDAANHNVECPWYSPK